MNKKRDNLPILIQTVLSFCIVFFGIIALYEARFLIVTQAILSLNMFLIAYNTYKQTKDKGISIAYLIMALICAITSIALVINNG